VEVEAYHQDRDRASHSYDGPTQRNRVMFGPPGNLYVYFIYGIHFCMNVVSEPESLSVAVLIRALEPVTGIDTMRRLRGERVPDRNLSNGPARCCQALAVNREQDGTCLQGPDLYLEQGSPCPPDQVVAATRIGITKSVELPWRFLIKDNPHVSRKTATAVKRRG